VCLDELGCERIDHGYHILEDPKVVARCRDEGIYFTCCIHSTAMVYGWRDLPNHPIKEMVDRGLRIMLNSDDPPFFHTDLGQEYVTGGTALGFGPYKIREFSLNGVEASWLDEGDKREMRQQFQQELDALEEQLAAR
jgi:adenosine deaminase